MHLYRQTTASLIVLLFASFCVSLLFGAESISDVMHLQNWDLIWDIRAPRLCTALGAGAATAMAGVLSQALFRNALATPSILGTEAGAGLGLALCAVAFGLYGHSYLVMVSTIAGAAIATAVALRFASGNQPLTRLLLGGFALNALLAAGTAMITGWLMESGQGLSIYHWLLGSFSARDWGHVTVILTAVVVAGYIAEIIARKLDILSLGDESAAASGIQVSRLRSTTFVLIAVLIGASMSVGGALPFVGLVVPHFIRIKSGPQLRPLLLNSAIGGASLVIVADLAARTLRAPIELDVGLLTTILGAPYFLWLLKKETGS